MSAAEALNQRQRIARNRARLAAGTAAPREHGVSTYVNWGCTCDVCRAAWAARGARRRHERAIGPDDPRHGRYSTYINYRCRCDACRAANAAQARKQRAAS